MEAERIEQYFIDRREALTRTASIEFIEGIVGALHAAIEKIAGIGILAIVGQFRIASVHGEIGGRGGVAACEQPRASAGKAKQVENIGRRTIGDATERVRQ